MTDVVFPLHWSISDVSGDSIVLEYTKEEGRRVFINEVGVVTNSPTYDWHTTNLKNYLNIQGEEFEKMYTRNNIQHNLKPFGHGTGMLGLPGDFTPPSRFIRTATFLRLSKRPKTVKDGVIKAWHILNSVDIVKEMMTGATDWGIVKDLANDVMYFRGLTYLGIRKIELNKLSGNAKNITIEAPFEEGVEEVTGKMEEKTKSRKNEL